MSKIGVFDSGIGGLSFLKEVRQLLPQYDYVYFGDTARVPYGSRSMETVKNYAEQDFQFMRAQDCSLTIVACNTISAEALRYLQQKYSDQKILGVLIPAVEHALAASTHGRIGVVGTRGTIHSNAFMREIEKRNPDAYVYQAACPLLVPLIEEGFLAKSPITRKVTKNYVRSLKDAHIDTLILGCTHYPLIESVFRDIMGKRVRVINSSRAAAQSLPDYLTRHPEIESKLSKNGTVQYFLSEVSDRSHVIGEKFMGQKLPVIETATLPE